MPFLIALFLSSLVALVTLIVGGLPTVLDLNRTYVTWSTAGVCILLAAMILEAAGAWKNVADWLEDRGVIRLLRVVEVFGIISAVILFYFEVHDRERDREVASSTLKVNESTLNLACWQLADALGGREGPTDRARIVEFLLTICPSLSGISLSKLVLDDISLPNATLQEVEFSGTKLARANFNGADLTMAKLESADLSEAQLIKATLSEANATCADLSDAKLEDASLWNATLVGANLVDAILRNSELILASLSNAHLIYADLEGADLHAANLENADLQMARFVGTNVESASFDGASLEGADFTGSNISQDQINTAHCTDPRRGDPPTLPNRTLTPPAACDLAAPMFGNEVCETP